MTIWISRRVAALLGCVALAGCDDATSGQNILAGLLAAGPGARTATPLTQALMMEGAVTLVPPTGYCIDPASLNQSFALMARCDTLGAATGSRGAPLGLMTVSLTPRDSGAVLPTPAEVAAASDTSAPQNIRDRGDHVIFAVEGPPPLARMGDRHWRAVAAVGSFTMGVALFGPGDKRAVSIEGAGMVEEMIQRTQDKTATG